MCLLTATSLLVDDVPLPLETAAGLCLPQNYERDYKGWVSVRTALGGSLNITTVGVVLLAGAEALRDRLRELGYLGLTEAGLNSRFGAPPKRRTSCSRT